MLTGDFGYERLLNLIINYICAVLSAMWNIGIPCLIGGLMLASYGMRLDMNLFKMIFFLSATGFFGLFIFCIADNAIRNRNDNAERVFWNDIFIKRVFFRRQGFFLDVYRCTALGKYPEDYSLHSRFSEITRVITPKLVFLYYYYACKYERPYFVLLGLTVPLFILLKIDFWVMTSIRLLTTVFFFNTALSTFFLPLILDDMIKKGHVEIEDIDDHSEYFYGQFIASHNKNLI